MSKKETIILGCNLATRSGKQKLLSLWPYLSVEEKIKILQEWKDDYVYNELLLLILEKDCEVVRYLAVKKTVLLEDDAEEKDILKKLSPIKVILLNMLKMKPEN